MAEQFNSLQTGDILLFTEGESSVLLYLFHSIISWWTKSPYVHCAFVLKNPTFIHPTLKGLYIWESGWEFGEPDPQDGQSKFGVQITPLYEYLRNSPNVSVYVRKLQSGHIRPSQLLNIHRSVYDKPYDINPIDWIGAAFRTPIFPQQTKRFWCSAFVTFILVQLQFVSETTNWDTIRPCDLSCMSNELTFTNCVYSEDERIL